MKVYLLIFFVALVLRLVAWQVFGTQFNFITNGDNVEYYSNSIDLKVNVYFSGYYNYDNWYERTPVYVLFLHLVQRQLIVQVLLSAIASVLMFKLNAIAGWLWCFYPQDIIYSFQYGKETLLLFMVITTIFLLKNHRKWLLAVIPLIIMGFASYGGVVNTNHALAKGFMNNVYELWKPAFNISIAYSKWFVYLQAIPYLVAMFLFFRYGKIFSIEVGIFLILTLVYGVVYADPRYREPFMPFLFLWVGRKTLIYGL